MSIAGNFIFMEHAGTFNRQVFLLIPAPETAGAVRPSELLFVPHKPPDNGRELFVVGIEFPSLFVCISFCPFEHLFFICIFFCHTTRPYLNDIPVNDMFLYSKTLVFALVSADLPLNTVCTLLKLRIFINVSSLFLYPVCDPVCNLVVNGHYISFSEPVHILIQ